MSSDDDVPPPAPPGERPRGAYWSAQRPAGARDGPPVDRSVRGRVIRLMWDYGVVVPLWDAEGLLPEETRWLREELRLSVPLIEDLKRWGLEMSALDAVPERRAREACEALDASARELARRLQREVEGRYTVQYRPW